MKKIVLVLAMLAVMLLAAMPAGAADSTKAATMRITEITGTVSVKNASGIEQSVDSGMRIYSGYTVETAAKSYAYISLDDSRVIKLDAESRAEIKKSGKKMKISLETGKLFFNVSDTVKSDETVTISTSTLLTGIRGTSGEVTSEKESIDLSDWLREDMSDGRSRYTEPSGRRFIDVYNDGSVFNFDGSEMGMVQKDFNRLMSVAKNYDEGEMPGLLEELSKLRRDHSEIKMITGSVFAEAVGPRRESAERAGVLVTGGQKATNDMFSGFDALTGNKTESGILYINPSSPEDGAVFLPDGGEGKLTERVELTDDGVRCVFDDDLAVELTAEELADNRSSELEKREKSDQISKAISPKSVDVGLNDLAGFAMIEIAKDQELQGRILVEGVCSETELKAAISDADDRTTRDEQKREEQKREEQKVSEGSSKTATIIKNYYS
ncbi:MAG: FecR domain-containing protein, partial [Oscillospiraceae bacterium]|nr:FecR domain-containing protein [Oscillospiraceae bacterium]